MGAKMVNVTRSFTRQMLTLVKADADSQSDDAMTPSHRPLDDPNTSTRSAITCEAPRRNRSYGKYLSDEDRGRATSQLNVPLAILQQIGERIQQANARGWIGTYHVPVLEESLTRR